MYFVTGNLPIFEFVTLAKNVSLVLARSCDMHQLAWRAAVAGNFKSPSASFFVTTDLQHSTISRLLSIVVTFFQSVFQLRCHQCAKNSISKTNKQTNKQIPPPPKKKKNNRDEQIQDFFCFACTFYLCPCCELQAARILL